MHRPEGDLRCSGSTLCNFNCTWTLHNFSTYDFTSEKQHQSAYFFTNRQSDLRFNLSVYPGEIHEETNEYVGCYLYTKFPDEENYKSSVTVAFSMSLCNSNGDIIITGEVKSRVFKYERGWGFRLIKRDELLPELTDDTLVICVEGLYSLSSVVACEDVKCFSDVSPLGNIGKTPSVKSDACISVNDFNIPVDTSILTARSKVFAAMFKHDTKEKMSRRIEIEDFDIEIVRSMVEFIHVGRVKLFNYKQALELLRAADKYDLEGLKTVCTMFLLCQMDNTNFADILACSETFNAPTLKREAIEYVCKNRDDIDVEKHDILLEHPKLLRAIVKALIDD